LNKKCKGNLDYSKVIFLVRYKLTSS
jgi:hypothetical protein